MLTAYEWDLEERAEDALVTHLKAHISRRHMIIPARTVAVATFPLIVVEAEPSDNATEDATFNGVRRLDLTVNITTEAMDEPDVGEPESLETARQIHRKVKSEVINALASVNLADHLNNTKTPGIVFSMAHMTDQDRDQGDHKLITMQAIDVIVSPAEIT